MRHYKRKRPRQWRDKDKRMRAAARMRGEGMSLRQIGRELAVSEGTIRNDLARWERQHPANVVPLVRKTTAQSRPAGGEITHPDYAARATGEVMGLTAKEEAMARAIASMTNRSGPA
jgi:lambda repressor-like predicted transcriptional regulator